MEEVKAHMITASEELDYLLPLISDPEYWAEQSIYNIVGAFTTVGIAIKLMAEESRAAAKTNEELIKALKVPESDPILWNQVDVKGTANYLAKIPEYVAPIEEPQEPISEPEPTPEPVTPEEPETPSEVPSEAGEGTL